MKTTCSINLTASIERGIDFLYSSQLSYGEFDTLVSPESLTRKATSCLASSPYITTFVIHSISFIENDSRINEMIEKSLVFLINTMEEQSTWRFYPQNNKKIVYRNGTFQHLDMAIVPDLDDTACASFMLRKHNVDFPDNSNLFYKVMTSEGTFPTWLLEEKTLIREQDYLLPYNDVCCGVNSNILMYLGDNPATKLTSDYINAVVLLDKEIESCGYFTNLLALYYLISRSFSLGVKSLEASRGNIISKILVHLRTGQQHPDAMSIILAVASLLNFNYLTDEICNWINTVINLQHEDGSWPAQSFFVDLGGNGYGSREFTTAIALEVISKAFLLIN